MSTSQAIPFIVWTASTNVIPRNVLRLLRFGRPVIVGWKSAAVSIAWPVYRGGFGIFADGRYGCLCCVLCNCAADQDLAGIQVADSGCLEGPGSYQDG